MADQTHTNVEHTFGVVDMLGVDYAGNLAVLEKDVTEAKIAVNVGF